MADTNIATHSDACTVIYVSEIEDSIVIQMHMIPAHSIDEAMEKAKKLLGNDFPSITVIPDGVSVIVK